MSINEQLAAYRAKKAAEKEGHGNKWLFGRSLSDLTTKRQIRTNTLENNDDLNPLIQQPVQATPLIKETRLPASNSPNASTHFSRFVNNGWFVITVPRVLTLLLWLILFGLFIELQFGSVFFIVSLFYFVYTSMESGSRDKERPSAYSVFNPNCERLDGTFTAEQFEKELRFGAMNVH